ncbi:hypothetical protein [Streptomyces sp. NPDC056683]|uniref:hypothetical protein n=1 Tax=Streptomyces sp. NPDC056683 TaxID=3345910 RepID=UPI0036B79152
MEKILAAVVSELHRGTQNGNEKGNETVSLSIEKVSPRTKVLAWTFGVALFGLLPIFWGYLSGSEEDSFWSLFGKGDLYMLAVVLLVGGLTEICLIFKSIDSRGLLATLVLGGLLLVVTDSARYGTATHKLAALAGDAEKMPHSVTWLSWVAYLLAALHSSTCVYLGAKAE